MLSCHADFVMADPLQLRKCQEVLGEQLPETESALWPFLKGVEGFDTARASDCLVKLLNNHYDTIAVLKLAEKRDLVEDAGILPGDALRIVRAARDYVARPPADSSLSEPPTTPTSKSEHRQDAYRPPAMRDLTGILNSPSRASDSSFQAFPQQEQPSASDSTWQAFPQQQQPNASNSTFQASPQQQQQPNAPNSTFQASPQQQQQPSASNSTFQAIPQQQQQQPSASESTFQAVPQKEQPNASQSTSQAIPQQQKGAAVSPEEAAKDPLPSIIRAAFPQEQPYVLGHVMNQSAAVSQQGAPKSGAVNGSPVVNDTPSSSRPTAPPPPPPSAPKRVTPPKNISYPHTCRLCDAKCPTEGQYLSHYTGKKHIAAVIESKQAAQAAKKAAAQPDPEPSSSNSEDAAPLHACGVCDVHCHSEVVLRSHFNGKRHAKKMELATESGDNSPTDYLYCSICDVTCPAKFNLVQHFNGKKHVQNMKEDEEESEEYYSE